MYPSKVRNYNAIRGTDCGKKDNNKPHTTMDDLKESMEFSLPFF